MKRADSAIYEIRIKGNLNHHWSDWFCNMIITHTPTGETILQGELPDQAALYGALNKLRDLGVTLISLNLIGQNHVSGRHQAK